MGLSAGAASYRIAFELSPIILVNGIAQNFPGQILPIMFITQALDFASGILGGADIDLESFFARFVPLPGSTLISQQLGEYPFANQNVAANAVIFDPLNISFRMICPAFGDGSYALKLATMTTLQASLSAHNQAGGTYLLITPSFIYQDCVMLRMHDVTAGQSAQVQTAWQMDFRQPLLTLQSALAAQNSLMSQITNGTMVAGQPAWSGAQAVSNPLSLAAPDFASVNSGTQSQYTGT